MAVTVRQQAGGPSSNSEERSFSLANVGAGTAFTTDFIDAYINSFARGCLVFINITAITGTTPTIVVTLQVRDLASGNWVDVISSAAINAAGMTVLRVYPGLTPAANLTVNDVLGLTYRLKWVIAGTTPLVTGSFGVTLVK